MMTRPKVFFFLLRDALNVLNNHTARAYIIIYSFVQLIFFEKYQDATCFFSETTKDTIYIPFNRAEKKKKNYPPYPEN